MSKHNKHRISGILMLLIMTICMMLPAGCSGRESSDETAPAA